MRLKEVASLTIIIPLLEETDTDLFEATLVSILENRPEEDDILVVNAAGYENCYDLTQEEGVVFISADPQTGLIDAINIGVQNSDTPFICPLLCGCEVAEDWARPALARLDDENTAVVIPKTRKTMAFADMALLCDEIGLDVLFEPNSVLTYSAELFPALNRIDRLTAQESLFRRWAGVWKERAQSHGWRLFKEKLFGGAEVRRAYALAKEEIGAPRPEQLLADAHTAAAETAVR